MKEEGEKGREKKREYFHGRDRRKEFEEQRRIYSISIWESNMHRRDF